MSFIKKILRILKEFFKNLFSNLRYRLKPRRDFKWFFSVILWFLIIVYVGFGIYCGFKVYKNHAEDKNTKFAVVIYPYPAVTVNGGIVWAKEYYQQLNYIRQFSEKTKQPIPDESALRAQIINQLIENKILQMQAVKYHVRVTTKDVNDAYNKIVEQSGGTVEVKKVLSELYGMNESDFKNLVRQQVLKEKIQNEVMQQVQVAHILIKDEARANDVAAQAKNNGDFAALAKQYSEDTKSKDAGGELGWLGKGQLVVNDTAIPEFDTAAFSAKKGEIVGPVKTSIGFEIIKVEDKKGQVNDSFDNWLAELEKKAKIYRLIN